MIYSIQIDFLHHFFKQLPLVPHITHWHSQFHRPKPPWFNLVVWRKINKGLLGINIQIITTRNKFFPTYPSVSNDLSTFTACSMLAILVFHTELNVCSIGLNLEPLIIENTDILHINHKHSYPFSKIRKNQDILRSSTHLHRSVHKPPWISSHIGLEDGDFLSQEEICHGLHMLRSATTFCTRAPSARQLQTFALLHLFQAVQVHDAHTCYRMNAILLVFIPVTSVVVPLLLWWAAYSAYRVLSNNLVNIAINLILLSFWVAGLPALCVERLGLEENLWPMYANPASKLQTRSTSTTFSRDVLVQEFRPNRRAAGNVEDLASLLLGPSGSVNVALTQRQHAREQDALQHLEKDMLSVLKALYDKCMHYGLNIGVYMSQEDAHLLDRINHE